MKRHYSGAVYDLTAENMNGLIEQLEAAVVRSRDLAASRNRYEDQARLAMKQLARAEMILEELASWSLDSNDLNNLSINGGGDGIEQSRAYFFRKIGAE